MPNINAPAPSDGGEEFLSTQIGRVFGAFALVAVFFAVAGALAWLFSLIGAPR